MSKDEVLIIFQIFLIIIVVFLGMLSLFIIISSVMSSNDQVITRQREMVLMEETRPIGEVKINRETESDITSAQIELTTTDEQGEPIDPGKKVYDSLCVSCHSTGLPNIPQLSSVDDWAERIAQGNMLLYERATNGFTGASGMVMPAKGGNISLSNDEVRAAVDYIIENSQ